MCTVHSLTCMKLFVAGVLPKYFSSEWSFAQFHLPEETRTIVAFGPQKNTVIIVCENCRFGQQSQHFVLQYIHSSYYGMVKIV